MFKLFSVFKLWQLPNDFWRCNSSVTMKVRKGGGRRRKRKGGRNGGGYIYLIILLH